MLDSLGSAARKLPESPHPCLQRLRPITFVATARKRKINEKALHLVGLQKDFPMIRQVSPHARRERYLLVTQQMTLLLRTRISLPLFLLALYRKPSRKRIPDWVPAMGL